MTVKKKAKPTEQVTWTIPCRVTLDGAIMTVTAATKEEAEAKARANNWDDIQYAHAELVDWDPQYGQIEKDE